MSLRTAPPLLERKADIIPLTEFFMNKFSVKFAAVKRRYLAGSEENAGTVSLAGQYPGNLQRTIERVILMEDGEQIESAHLAFLAFPYHTSQQKEEIGVAIPPEGIKLDDLIKRLIVQALEMSGSTSPRRLN